MLRSVILNWGKISWCWERLKAGGEGDDRGWDGWMASLTGWTWVWVSSRSWWWTEKPDVLQSTGSETVGHDWVTDVNWDYEPRGHLAMSRGIFGCQSWHRRWYGQGASSGRRSGMPLSSLQCTGQHQPQRMTPPPMPTVWGWEAGLDDNHLSEAHAEHIVSGFSIKTDSLMDWTISCLYPWDQPLLLQ